MNYSVYIYKDFYIKSISKHRMKKLVLAILIAVLLMDCGNHSDSNAKENYTEQATSSEEAGSTVLGLTGNTLTDAESPETKITVSSKANTVAEVKENTNAEGDKSKEDLKAAIPKLIKNGYLTIEVKDHSKARKNIAELVAKNWGYLGNETEEYETYRVTNTLVLRVPIKAFDQIMTGIISEGLKTDSKRVEVQDVGEEYADLQARISSKLAVEKRYLDILNKANKISDILEVEEKLRAIREEIESAQGRVKYLESQVTFSTITLSYYKTLDAHYIPPSGPGFFSRIWKGIVKGWEGLLEIIIAITYLWPLWLVCFVVFFFIRSRTNKGWPFHRKKV